MTETRAEPFTPAERAVMAARAEAQAARLEAERMRREIVGYWKGEVAHADERAATFKAERDAAVRSVAALFHAYIAITPGETVEGLEPKVQAQADELLGYLIELEARHSDVLALTAPLADENANLRAQLAETSARLADLARQATAAGPVLEAAIRLDDADSECIAHHVMYPNDEDGEIELMVEYRAARQALTAAVAALRAAREGK